MSAITRAKAEAPANTPISAEPIRPSRSIRIVHNRLLGGWFVVRGPHQTPLGGRFDSCADALAWLEQRR